MATQMPLPIQTMYAELVERAHMSRFAEDFDDPAGIFVKKRIRDRYYWYFRPPMVGGASRRDRYVGLESPELQKRVTEHRIAKDSYKQRRAMVSALLRTGFRGPDVRTGCILNALSKAGVFRMRAVVVGTIAYQVYSGLLGVKLRNAAAMTDDLDLAQPKTISIALEDQLNLPFLEILRSADLDFRPLPEVFAPGELCQYALRDSYRVNILTLDRRPNDETPVALPALRTETRPRRYLDFLIYEKVQAVALYGAGIPINVPVPERFCLHKLIVSRLRIETKNNQAMARKGLRQAGELLRVLCDQRPYEIRDLWEELHERGPKWVGKAAEAVGMLDAATGSSRAREALEAIVGRVVPANGLGR